MELDVHMADDPKLFLENSVDVSIAIDYPPEIYDEIHPIFVSRMPNHKVTGAAHKDTIRSPRHYKERGTVLTRTAITDLKLNKDGEIEGHYNKESDWRLYRALKAQLAACGNDGKIAFAGGFHKPKADGTDGPVVKKVLIESKQTSGVAVNNSHGIAENGSMVRIDVFRENGKYYFVPIYTADVVKKVLPNKAATAHKPYESWREMEDKNFLFSLYSRDLIHIVSKKGIKANLTEGGQVILNEMYTYYMGADSWAASISGKAHDSRYEYRGLGIQSLDLIEKCQVDVLGNISVVRHEVRMGFS